ncbi:Flp family type IVb pilin [Cupriavidus sp. H39]|uniref:Flp family type IVb pilin n=1 Tax=Cupriavidus sp. H39 TaxID=3401635 RepID=UPI003D049DA0
MKKIFTVISNLLHDDAGVSSIEYALLGMLIAIAIVSAVSTVGDSVKLMYELIASRMP